MDAWLDLARGPLFTASFLIMVLGLARHVAIQVAQLARGGHLLRGARWRRIVGDAMSWVVPVRHLVRGTVALTLISILFHLGVVLVPVLLADHVAMWERLLGIRLPSLAVGAADLLTLAAIGCGLVLLGYRLTVTRSRALSRPGDYLALVVVLLPMITGYAAAHPASIPVPWPILMLVHILSAEVLLVAIPFSKLSHVVLFPFERLSQAYWQLKPGAGDEVARALWGDEVHV